MDTINDAIPQASNKDAFHQFVQALAKTLIANSERAYEWLQGVPLTDDMLEVSDVIQELHSIADDPETYMVRNRPSEAAYLIAAYAGTIGRLNAAYRGSTKGVV